MNKTLHDEIDKIIDEFEEILIKTPSLIEVKKALLYPMANVLSAIAIINGKLIVKDPESATAMLKRNFENVV